MSKKIKFQMLKHLSYLHNNHGEPVIIDRPISNRVRDMLAPKP
jgi:hypothetical protein